MVNSLQQTGQIRAFLTRYTEPGYMKTNHLIAYEQLSRMIIKRLPFLVLAFIWRKKIPQSIPRDKRIEFIRNSSDSDRFRGILDFSLYSNFLSTARRHIFFLLYVQSCANSSVDVFVFVFSRENPARPKKIPRRASQNWKLFQRKISPHQ